MLLYHVDASIASTAAINPFFNNADDCQCRQQILLKFLTPTAAVEVFYS